MNRIFTLKIFGIVKLIKLMTILLILITGSVCAQTTYTVTATTWSGPGSLSEAIELANANPGKDHIVFTPGLKVDARGEAENAIGTSGADKYVLAQITDAVTIDGNGGELFGSNTWFNYSGVQSFEDCPQGSAGEDTDILVTSVTPGLFTIGKKKQDNSNIEVIIENLEIRQFNHVIYMHDMASLIMNHVTVKEIYASFKCESEAMITAKKGSSVSIRNSSFIDYFNFATVAQAYTAAIIGDEAGELYIENTDFTKMHSTTSERVSTIYWTGAAGSRVNIVSSTIQDSGGIQVEGEVSETNIVNSIWNNLAQETPRTADFFSNASTGDMNFIASTMVWNSDQCDGWCLEPDAVPLYLFDRQGSGKINFKQSAIGINFPADPDPGTESVFTLHGDGFTADEFTWIQPTIKQDAGTLEAVTGQSSLMTDPPAFNHPVFSFYLVPLVTPASPGELIDVIPDAGSGGVNELKHPIWGTPITKDAFGNSRVDGDLRTIGAVQVTLTPHLLVEKVSDQSVLLHWSKPNVPDQVTHTGYELEYRITGSPSWTTETVNGEETLKHLVSGLTNGTEYEFQVRAAGTQPTDPVDGTTPDYFSPWSNIVKATPLGEIGTPVVTATPGDGEVALSWNEPDLGGRHFEGYGVIWRKAGTDEVVGALPIYNYNETATTITGLTNGTEYEFAVAVNASGEVSEQGLATATPFRVAPPTGNDNCTLTQGYWSTHSEYGPSAYNDTWAQLSEGASTDFFASGQSYYEVINAPTKNNAYYILARQYIATELNALRGADMPQEAQDAFSGATDLFNQYLPADIKGLKKSDPLRKAFVDYGSILDRYNNGVIGPGHCDSEMKSSIKENSVDTLEDGIISYYPNPVQDVLYLSSNEKCRVRISSISGRLIIDQKIRNSIDISHLKEGLYFIQIEVGDEVLKSTIIKN